MVENQNNISLSDVTLLFILFILVFFGVIILALLLKNIKNIYNSSKSYYFTIFLLLISMTIAYLIYGFKIAITIRDQTTNIYDNFRKMYLIFFFLTDISLILLLIVICNKYSIFYFKSIISSKHNTKLPKFILVFQIIIIATLSGILVSYSVLQKPSLGIVMYIYATGNFGSIFCLFLTQFYLNIKLTGTFVQKDNEEYISHFKKLQMWFFISRSLSGVWNLIIGSIIISPNANQSIFKKYIKNFIIDFGDFRNETTLQMVTNIFLFICVQFITFCVPLILSVQERTIKILEMNKKKDLKQSLLSQNISFLIPQLQDSNFEQNSIQKTNFNELFHNGEAIKNTNSNNIGIIRKCKYRSKLYAIRQIQLEISKYLLEQVNNQVNYINQSAVPALLNIKYLQITQSNKKIYFIMEYINNLRDYLQICKLQLRQKVQIALQICNTILQLHKLNLPHGTLKFTNIFIQKKNNQYIVKLGDYGLLSLKKFLNLTKGYINKTVFTAPQFLGEKLNVINKPTKQGDVYAFGMVMYELFTQNYSYGEMTLKQLEKSFKQNKTRPKIPDNMQNNLRNLIRSCWQQDPQMRPPLEQVKTYLRQYLKT